MRVILASKNFSKVSHIGLGVSALNTCKTLRSKGIAAEAWSIVSCQDLRSRLNSEITHVIISAPWIPTAELNALCRDFPFIHFVVNCHSNVGFLQADAHGVKLLREDLDLEMALPNFKVSANSKKMSRWVSDAYGSPCLYLPNLYYLNGMQKHHRPLWRGGHLRIGVFGALRPQKNVMSSVAAAIEISHQLKTHVDIFISTGRMEGGAQTILNAVKQMTSHLPTVTLHESGWASWAQFRTLVGSMHLLLQPSYTESFNMVTADGIAEGVPSVVSEAIDWVPRHWKADSDDVFSIANVGRNLIHDHHAASEGLKALEVYIEHGWHSWEKYLKGL